MITPIFYSILAEPLAQFVQYKRALNRKYHTEEAALPLLDCYLSEHAIVSWEAIDSELIDPFLKCLRRARPRSYNHLGGVPHRFFASAVLQRLTTQNRIFCPRRPGRVRINVWRPDAVELCLRETRRQHSNREDRENENNLLNQLTASLGGGSILEQPGVRFQTRVGK